MTNRFDLVFSLGSACSSTQALRAAGLQFASFPLDWVSGSDFLRRAQLLADGFRDWLRAEDFESVENVGAFGHDTYRNRVTDLTHPHDFDKGVPLAESFPRVKEKYDRRIARLFSLLSSSRRVLVVWVMDPRDAAAPDAVAVQTAHALLTNAWPHVDFHFLVTACEKGVSYDDRRESFSPLVDCILFDYVCHASDAKPWSVVPALLHRVMQRYTCHDYRTKEEMRAERERQRLRKWKRYGATSLWAYHINRLEYRLWHHLYRALKKKGGA